jgi:DNA-binding NarL/FixJ family response regulator
MRVGAAGYLLKTSAASELVKAIRGALKGKRYITPSVSRGVEELFIRDPELKRVSKDLTPRQREVLQLLAEGHPMKEIGYILKLSSRTVAFHKYRMMEHLESRARLNSSHSLCRTILLSPNLDLSSWDQNSTGVGQPKSE